MWSQKYDKIHKHFKWWNVYFSFLCGFFLHIFLFDICLRNILLSLTECLTTTAIICDTKPQIHRNFININLVNLLIVKNVINITTEKHNHKICLPISIFISKLIPSVMFFTHCFHQNFNNFCIFEENKSFV